MAARYHFIDINQNLTLIKANSIIHERNWVSLFCDMSDIAI